MRRVRSRFGALVTVAVLTLASGCGLSAQNVPLPGKGVAGDTYRLSAKFTDALNLTEGAPVKLNGATVGQVQRVTVQDYTAKVDMDVKSTARLHAGSSARLRGTTPLGELYVDLSDGTSPTVLADGAVLTEGTVAPTIEDTMATTSVFLNGGGITELGTIIRESNRALGGREETARDVLTRLDSTIQELEASTDDLDRTLVSLAGLSTSLRERRTSIRAALDEVGPTARALKSQIEDLATLLRHVEGFGSTTTAVIKAVRKDLVRSLSQMGPIFDEMNALEGDLTPTIQKLVLFSQLLDKAVPTRYLNTDLHIHLDQAPSLPLPVAAAKKSGAQSAGGNAPLARPGGLPPVALPSLPQVDRIVDPKPLIENIVGILQRAQR